MQGSREKVLELSESSVSPAFLVLAGHIQSCLFALGRQHPPFFIQPPLLASGGHYPCPVLLIPETSYQANTVAIQTPLYGAEIEAHRGLPFLLLSRWKNVGLLIF